MATPSARWANEVARWASVEIRSFTPASIAALACAGRRSSRCGPQLISRKVPVRAAASTTACDVELVPVAAAEQPARRMGDHVDVRVLDRGEQPARRPLGVLTLADVQRGDDPVEPGEQVVVVVQRPVGHHVDLGTGEQREAVEARGVLADLLDVALDLRRRSSPIPMPTPAEWSVIAR